MAPKPLLILDVIACGLALMAETQRSDVDIEMDLEMKFDYCVYTPGIATQLGIAAVILLILNQIIMIISIRGTNLGMSVSSGRSKNRTLEFFIFIGRWLFLCLAEICLFLGSIQNSARTKDTTPLWEDPPLCKEAKKGIFFAGAVSIMCGTIILYLYSITCSNATEAAMKPFHDIDKKHRH